MRKGKNFGHTAFIVEKKRRAHGRGPTATTIPAVAAGAHLH